MRSRKVTFLTFLLANVLAAYAPAVSWVPDLGGTTSVGCRFLFSPVAFALLVRRVEDPDAAWGVLAVFLLLLVVISALLSRWKKAWVAVPVIVFVVCLVQGQLFAAAISGIDAIGH